jgi:hypothetical protein
MKPIFKQVDHILVIAPDARQIFLRFSGDFKFPVAWEYKDYGDFASGGVFAGNTNLEFLAPARGTKVDSLCLGGIAFSPATTATDAAHEMDGAGFLHGPPTPFSTGGNLQWTSMDIPKLMETVYGVFICEYAFDRVARHAAAREQMAKIKGGPLTMDVVRKVVFDGNVDQWQKLLKCGTVRGHFALGAGPELVVSPAPSGGGLVFKVHSLAAAREYLKSKGWLGEDRGSSVTMKLSEVPGLEFLLAE